MHSVTPVPWLPYICSTRNNVLILKSSENPIIRITRAVRFCIRPPKRDDAERSESRQYERIKAFWTMRSTNILTYLLTRRGTVAPSPYFLASIPGYADENKSNTKLPFTWRQTFREQETQTRYLTLWPWLWPDTFYTNVI